MTSGLLSFPADIFNNFLAYFGMVFKLYFLHFMEDTSFPLTCRQFVSNSFFKLLLETDNKTFPDYLPLFQHDGDNKRPTMMDGNREHNSSFHSNYK